MSTDHNRIKVADLEKNEPNKTLITNENGELEFSDITGGEGSQDLQSVLNNSGYVTGDYSYITFAVEGDDEYMLDNYASFNRNVLQIQKKDGAVTSIFSAQGDGIAMGIPNTGISLKVNPSSEPNSYLRLLTPLATEGSTDKVLATTSDFKTINGQSLIGIGDIAIDNFVHKTGEVREFIDGEKIFRDNISFKGVDNEEWVDIGSSITYSSNGGNQVSVTLEQGLDGQYIHRLPAKDGTYAMLDDLNNSLQGSGTMDYISKWSSTTGRLVNSRILDTGTNISIPSFAPPTANSQNIGTSSLYYNQAFIQTGFINNVNSNITKTNSLTIGMSNTSGLINFVRASDGAVQGGVGYAASNNSSEVRLTSNGGGAFITFYAAGGEGFRLSGNRNLLVGTQTDNGYKLDINGSMRGASNLTLGAVGTSGSLLMARSSDGSPVCNYGFPSATENNEVRATHSGGGGYFTWITNSNAVVTEKMRLSNLGNLLIGAAADSGLYKIDITGASRLNGTITIADPVTSAGTYDILTKNSNGVIQKIPGSALPASGSYTPTVSASSNITFSNVVVSKWTKINNTYSVRVNFGVSGVTTTGTVSTLTINLPFNRTNTTALSVGSGTIGNGGDRIYPVMAISQSASTVTFYFTQSVSETAGGSVLLTYDLSE